MFESYSIHFLLAILLSILRFTVYDYSSDIVTVKPTLYENYKKWTLYTFQSAFNGENFEKINL